MSDYAFVHEGRVFTPNQTRVKAEDAEAHNAAIEAAELAAWTGKPDRMLGYYSFPAEDARTGKTWRARFEPLLGDRRGDPSQWGRITMWRGQLLGYIVKAEVYPHNFGGRMVSVTVQGTNGARYYGRASYDWGQCVRLRRVKGK